MALKLIQSINIVNEFEWIIRKSLYVEYYNWGHSINEQYSF